MPTSSNPPQDVTMKPLMTSPRTPHHPPRTRPTCTHPRVCPLCTSCCNRDITMMSPFLALLLVAILNKLKRGTQLDNLAPILLLRATYIYPNFQTISLLGTFHPIWLYSLINFQNFQLFLISGLCISDFPETFQGYSPHSKKFWNFGRLESMPWTKQACSGKYST